MYLFPAAGHPWALGEGAQLAFQAEDGLPGVATSEAARLGEQPLVCKPQRYKTHLVLLFFNTTFLGRRESFYNAGCITETCYLLLYKQLDPELVNCSEADTVFPFACL